MTRRPTDDRRRLRGASLDHADRGPRGVRPDDADPFIDPAGPTPGYALFGNLHITDDAIYSTGVHCRRCGCGVARMDRETGVTSCPNCGWEGR